MSALSHPIKDPPTQRAVRQLELQLDELRQRISVSGATTADIVASLLAALERLGIISDDT